MTKQREPSCVLNHDVMRKELRDKGLEPTPCPECHWLLSPSKPEPLDLQDDRVFEFTSPESSSVQSANYDYGTETLTVDFKGHTYIYRSVPESVWTEFHQAMSKGQFLNSRIRPHYIGRRV